ncbi:Stf0 family sulfotransferase [Shimia aestuarii]|uniref:LPS sulfotransferase NodH n=1 Tax=Shimia aestuarii TaxID=254406 RepID=A0A1I4K620_9RHOB|nr:Stf0 family sulfotransferase [Shimia aestuarii]SFL74160.1 LPS sulfotransferase NodH [Shimia aestuarii]
MADAKKNLIARGLGFLQNPFREVEANPARAEQVQEMALADPRYVIFFTPRSGSSRLTDLLTHTGALGKPDEVFNPAFMPAIAQFYGATSMRTYTPLLLRGHQLGGVFGCEVTFLHIMRAFGTGARFLKALQPKACLWLVREDIVAQAVSVLRMLQTRQAHAIGRESASGDTDDAAFRYDAMTIRLAIWRIRWMEQRTERLFSRNGLQPLRLSYERTIAMDETALIRQVALHVGVELGVDVTAQNRHQKLGGQKSDDFAQRFREDNPRFVARLDRARAQMIAALQN